MTTHPKRVETAGLVGLHTTPKYTLVVDMESTAHSNLRTSVSACDSTVGEISVRGAVFGKVQNEGGALCR